MPRERETKPGRPHRLRGLVSTSNLIWQLAPRPLVAWLLACRLRRAEERWLFIVGVNNSGTTLLWELLRAHPAIAGMAREGQFGTWALPEPMEYGVPRIWTERSAVFRWREDDGEGADPKRVRFDWIWRMRGLDGARYLLEKSPPSCLRARWLQRHFAGATFIVVTRSPYAVAEGVRRRHGVSITRAAAHWARAYEAVLEDLPHLERQLVVSYEELAAQPEATLARVTSFLGLPPLAGEVTRGAQRVNNADEAASVIRDFNAGSLARLAPDDVTAITALTGEVMARLGYAPVEPAPASRSDGVRG